MMNRLRALSLTILAAAAVTTAFAADEPKPTPAPAAAPAAAAAPAPAAAAAPAAAPATINAPSVNKATIELDEKATANGDISFTFTPAGGKPVAVRVTIVAKSKADDIAKDVEKEFKVSVGPGFDVDRSGRKVEIKGLKKGMFQLTIASQNAPGLSVRVK